MYKGTVKLMADSIAAIVNSARTAARSAAPSTTWSARSGIFPSESRLRVQTRNAEPRIRPTTIIIGAGERPKISNGAAGRTSSSPQFRILLKPRLRPLELEAKHQDCGSVNNQEPERHSPTDIPFQRADDQECQHPRHSTRRTEPAQRLRLLLASIVIGYENDQRGDQSGSRQTGQTLCGEHNGGGRANYHCHHRG